MIRLLIVDDETIERVALRDILLKGIQQIEVVGLAENGRRAIELAVELTPDLILMDIRMPGIDGLEAIKTIQASHPATKFIMVSAHDEFQYAQRAVRLGVEDYILKPSRASEILQAVNKVIQRIQNERADKEERQLERNRLGQIIPMVETDLVTQLLFDRVHDVHVEEMLSFVEMQSAKEFFVLVAYLLPREQEAIEPSHAKTSYRWFKQQFHQHGKGWVGAMSGQHIPVVVLHEGGVSYRAYAAVLIRKLLDSAAFLPSYKLFIGVGNPVGELEKIRQSYHEAQLAASHMDLPSGHRFFCDVESAGQAASKSHAELEKQIVDEARRSNWHKVKLLFNTALQSYEEMQMKVVEADQRVLDLLLVIWRSLEQIGIAAEKPYFPSQHQGYFQLRAETELLLDRLTAVVEEFKKELEPDLFLMMKNFILQNAHEEISLEMIADHVRLSPYYVSKLFKEEFGVNYIDFLTDCRIEKAKEYMGDQSKSLKEISYDVGYKDPNYFSRVFRKTTGLTPTEYRSQLLQPKQS